ncbi:NADH-quinone oxidoreductase subunit L [Phaeovibrio sulfidiphilus]|uniref:NADH-ubiquinone oxidoreductase chain 5 n=1 Tax=Phaeovibrio sulfidiphilus TaxID=1220600 RepID=A0A8J6YWS5_9PROT|nr:NADH-quinone oxidoreductase subunit L [Phaeovibrio sulfidiphilus]MBE1237077.1 NADH-quinone oxidoreductase subunit L [Phaeovibrio sulfidiphilus]
MLAVTTVFLPLLTAALVGLLSRSFSDRVASVVTCSGLGLSALCSWLLFFQIVPAGEGFVLPLMTWASSGALAFDWALRIDTLSVVMLTTVTTISFLVHVYSVGYMAKDRSVPRFMAYLSLFTFFMLMLVTADNLIQLFFGWEGVGLSSYLLIGFWFERPSANAAAVKAFLVNRVGDLFFLMGIFCIFWHFGSVQFATIFEVAPSIAHHTVHFLWTDWNVMTLACVLLFLGAMGKSAQIGLHTWLPDAMEGPTPVSALIHAATMVTAGVFLVARMSPLFTLSDTAMTMVTVVGAATAFFAATVACTQTDIKRVIAYSTCSQLGYMFFALGVGAFGAGIFHLMTHAFFKALLFLGAGSVIHAMSDEQDMRKMGGIWKLIPLTYAMMWIGSLALMGIWPFAGYFSKDTIIEAAYAASGWHSDVAFYAAIVVATLTAFYSTRLIALTFHGAPRADERVMDHVHESPRVMTLPLVLLAVGAVLAGVLGYNSFVGDGRFAFWAGSIVGTPGDVTDLAHHVPLLVKLAPLVCSLFGVLAGVVFYVWKPCLPGRVAGAFPLAYRFLLNKWYFDEVYNAVFIRPAFAIGRLFWKTGDRAVIDGLGPDGLSRITSGAASVFSRIQNGLVSRYAFVMIFGLTGVVTWLLMTAFR